MAKIILGEADNRVLIKDIMRHPGFEMVQHRYDAEIERMVTAMLNPNTSDAETLILKGAIQRLRQLSPQSIASSLLKTFESKLSKMQTNGVIVASN
jgi:hypothetical protein